jgi:hypothetical protein
VFSILHPAFFGHAIIDEGPGGKRYRLAITGLHEPPSLLHGEIPETEWTDYQKWFSTVPTMLAVSCGRQHMVTNL